MKKSSSQLVCQYLEKVSRSAIEKHQDIIKQFIRKRHGIYALYKNDRLVYVGLATNLKTRLSHHLHDRHATTWNRFSVYITIDGDKLRELETLTLRISNPRNNRQTGKFAHAEDLKRKFKKIIQLKQKKELHHIFEDEKKEVVKKVVRKKVAGRKAILGKYISRPIKIKLVFRSKTYRARVNKDGIILLDKKKFSSPSAAAKHIIKYSVDGWIRWNYERSPGEWVQIDKLRK
ncbi:MAG: GIY-YIG nuclease family protein [Ignavibacteriae bacterium]|nr:GIY-YIG nuclease family protein [Ignavibacteriota bacterium]